MLFSSMLEDQWRSQGELTLPPKKGKVPQNKIGVKNLKTLNVGSFVSVNSEPPTLDTQTIEPSGVSRGNGGGVRFPLKFLGLRGNQSSHFKYNFLD